MSHHQTDIEHLENCIRALAELNSSPLWLLSGHTFDIVARDLFDRAAKVYGDSVEANPRAKFFAAWVGSTGPDALSLLRECFVGTPAVDHDGVQYRKATKAEIFEHYRHFRRVRFKHFTREMHNPRACNGVSHRQYSSAKLRDVGGVPHVQHQGKLEPITALHFTLPGGQTFVARTKLDSPHLSFFDDGEHLA